MQFPRTRFPRFFGPEGKPDKAFLEDDPRNATNLTRTIVAQIKAGDPMALGAWGARNFIAIPAHYTPSENPDVAKEYFIGGAAFQVSGMLVKGWVTVRLNGSDVYQVDIYQLRRGEWLCTKTQTDVYCDMLTETIDRMIERVHA